MLKSLSQEGNVHTLGNCSCVALPPASMQSNINVPAKQPRCRFEKDGVHELAAPFRAASRFRESVDRSDAAAADLP
jgi:hypothetical protein